MTAKWVQERRDAVAVLEEAAKIIDLNNELFRSYMPGGYELDWARALAEDIQRFARIAQGYPAKFKLPDKDGVLTA